MLSAVINGNERTADKGNLAVCKVGDSVTLNHNRTSATSHSWDYGEGTSNQSNPVVQFNTPGTKDISYTPDVGRKEFQKRFIVVLPDWSTPDHIIVGQGNSMLVDGVSTTNSYINCLGWNPGDVVHISGNFTMSDRITFMGATGTEANPIYIVNQGVVTIACPGFENCVVFQGCKWVTMCGNTDPSEPYGYQLSQGIQAYGFNYNSEYQAWGLKFYGIDINGQGVNGDCGIGFQIKAVNQSYSADPAQWWFTDTEVAGCRVRNTNSGGEGIYFGYFHFYGISGFYPSIAQRVYFYRNYMEDCGRDGIQIGCAINSEVHDNFTNGCGTSAIGDHTNGIQINSGSGVLVYSNLSIGVSNRDGRISVFPYEDCKVFNNIFYDPVGTFAGIWFRSIANQAGAPHDNMSPTLVVDFINNTIVTQGDGLYYFKDVDNVNEANVINNIFDYGLGKSARNWTNDQPTTLNVANNYDSQGAASQYFNDVGSEDFTSPQSNPALTTGQDQTSFYNSIFGDKYDGYGLEIVGDWHAGALQYDDETYQQPDPGQSGGASLLNLMMGI